MPFQNSETAASIECHAFEAVVLVFYFIPTESAFSVTGIALVSCFFLFQGAVVRRAISTATAIINNTKTTKVMMKILRFRFINSIFCSNLENWNQCANSDSFCFSMIFKTFSTSSGVSMQWLSNLVLMHLIL